MDIYATLFGGKEIVKQRFGLRTFWFVNPKLVNYNSNLILMYFKWGK